MLELLIVISLSPAFSNQTFFNEQPVLVPPTGIMTAKAVKPCLWPNPCSGGAEA